VEQLGLNVVMVIDAVVMDRHNHLLANVAMVLAGMK